jgi:NodT family efflux transporter outer membrane factor (OMF) lipoprotein
MKTTKPALAALAAALLLAGCASYKGIEPEATLRTPPVPGASAQAVVPVRIDWWKEFGDAQLDRLVDQALRDNPNLGVARARLRRAQAAAEGADANRYPNITGQADVTRQRFSENFIYPPPLGGSRQTVADAQANLNWELDFFGKNQAALEAALGNERASQADLAAARVVLASNVARTYFQLVRVQEQLAVANRTLQQREQQLKLVNQRVGAGLDTTLQQRQSEGAIPDIRQQIEALREQADTTRNALAALVASQDVPAVGQLPALRNEHMPAALPALPADLLGRRPDVVAARLRVEAGTADLRSARAQFYPSINLTGFIGLQSLGLSRLVDMGSEQWSVGPAIRLPIFDAGRLRANYRGRTADLDAAIESYNNAVLEAFHEAGDAIAAVQSVARQQAEQVQAERAAEGAYDIALQRYRAGLGTFLDVLSAETNVLAQRRLGVDLAARALDARVTLYRALGGGYSAATEEVASH